MLQAGLAGVTDVSAKQCKKCFKVKDLEEFGPSTTARDGHRSQCRDCKRRQDREALRAPARRASVLAAGSRWRARNPGKFEAWVAVRYRYLQEESLEHAGNRGELWSAAEIELAARTDLTAAEVAAMTGRTFSAVMGKRRQLRRDGLRERGKSPGRRRLDPGETGSYERA